MWPGGMFLTRNVGLRCPHLDQSALIEQSSARLVAVLEQSYHDAWARRNSARGVEGGLLGTRPRARLQQKHADCKLA